MIKEKKKTKVGDPRRTTLNREIAKTVDLYKKYSSEKPPAVEMLDLGRRVQNALYPR
jgi:hypothetical protein